MSYYTDLDNDLGVDAEVEEMFREKGNQEHEDRKDMMRSRYRANKKAEVGATINCAYCNRIIIKKQYSQCFCSPVKKNGRKTSKCKDGYWNYTDDKRNERTQRFK